MYADNEELNNLHSRLAELDNEVEEWLYQNENKNLDEERELDEKELNEENKLISKTIKNIGNNI